MSIATMFANENRNLKRSCESLLGICTGLLADGQLNESEIKFLNQWLLDHEEIASTWPGEVLAIRIKEALSDGVITPDELEHLKLSLSDLIGGTLQETGVTGGLSTKMSFDDESAIPIEFSQMAFCFTGQFLYGTRAACERSVQAKGAQSFSDVRKNLDYLVVGTMASRDWANSSHGRKIEKAFDYQSKGSSLLIVSEEHWIRHL